MLNFILFLKNAPKKRCLFTSQETVRVKPCFPGTLRVIFHQLFGFFLPSFILFYDFCLICYIFICFPTLVFSKFGNIGAGDTSICNSFMKHIHVHISLTFKEIWIRKKIFHKTKTWLEHYVIWSCQWRWYFCIRLRCMFRKIQKCQMIDYCLKEFDHLSNVPYFNCRDINL